MLRIKYQSWMVILLCLLAVNIPYFSQRTNNIITLLIELALLTSLRRIKVHKLVKRSDNLYILFVFSCSIVLSTFLNCGLSTRTVNAVVTALKYYLFFYVTMELTKQYSSRAVLHTAYRFFGVLVLISNTCAILTLGNGLGREGILPFYITGNKFYVCFSQMLFLALYIANCVVRDKRNNWRIAALFAYSAMISILVDCVTGTIGILVLYVTYLLFHNHKNLGKLLSSPLTYLLVFVGATVLLVGSDVLLGNPVLQKLITKVFKRSLTLTGRLEMFAISIETALTQPLLGFGINCTVVQDKLTWGNPQNGLLKMFLDYGLLGIFCFLALCGNVFAKAKRGGEAPVEKCALRAFLYAMAICSMVEINLGGIFFLGLALLNCDSLQNDVRMENR